MIPGRAVLLLGISQLVCWGVTYYLIGAFGELIGAETGWSRALVHGGFSAAMVVMGLTSPLTGRLIDRHGGGRVMAAGSLLAAAGCLGVAWAQDIVSYYAAWLCLGLAMRFTLYDAAFATLVRIGGPGARRAMSQITLLGGLASTVFWPLGHLAADLLGWRGALVVYAAAALATLPLHLAMPRSRHGEGARPVPDPATPAVPPTAPPPAALRGRDRLIAGSLYALIAMLVSFLNSGMSAHMIGILAGLGLALSAAVWISTLRGIAQSLARLADILFGGRLHPLLLNALALSLLPLSFLIALGGGQFIALALAFAFLYGAGNGIATITRGSVPLALFGHRSYGAFVGRLLVPSFLFSAAAPICYALVMDSYGAGGALWLSALLAAVAFGASLALKLHYGSRAAAS